MSRLVKQHAAGEFVRNFGVNLLYDILGSFFFAVGIYNFAAQADFAPGGFTGIAILINHFTKLPIGSIALILNIPIILMAFRTLGKKFLVRSFQTIIVNTLFLDIICPKLPVYNGEPLLAALFAGALAGIGLAIIYQNKSCTGGSDLIIMTLRKKKPHMSVGQITMFVDGLIVLSGGLVFHQIDAVLYGFVYSTVMILVIDKMMFGFVSGKLAMIISEHGEEISKKIGKELERGSTILRAKGAYSNEHRPVVMCACSRSQVPEMRKFVMEIDPDALMIVTSYDEVYGEGFLPIDE
ncbi:MAG TPA: YitT family protein [Clostridia bacterium]|nr:YitT family protein [Clostridia bacterium]